MTRIDSEHRLFLQWLLFAGVLIFCGWLLWQQGLLAVVFDHDPTRLSLVIGLMFLACCGHCGLRAWYLSGQLNQIRHIRLQSDDASVVRLSDGTLLMAGAVLPPSLPTSYFSAILNKFGRASHVSAWQFEHSQLTEVMAEQARGQHETGWFMTGLLVKLGLVGTVVGFVLMLGSIATIESFDVADVQSLLQQMTVGMGVALNTTLLGLVGSMLLGFQYLMLDRGADKLVADTVHFAEVSLFPKSAEPEVE